MTSPTTNTVTDDRSLREALEKATSDNVLYYLKSIQRALTATHRENIKAMMRAVDDVNPGPSLASEVDADNRDWLDCHIDWLERTARAALSTHPHTGGREAVIEECAAIADELCDFEPASQYMTGYFDCAELISRKIRALSPPLQKTQKE